MAKKKDLVLVPVAMDENGLAKRRTQQNSVELGDNIEFDYRPVKAGPALYDSYHDFALADVAMFEAGISAEQDGYDAVCIDTMSDSGLDALRSVLDIPVISPGKASMLFALMLGNKFGMLAQWEPAAIRTRKFVSALGLAPFCAAIENYDVTPDYKNLMGGKEDETFPRMLAAAKRAIEKGADVICLGSTTMYQAHEFLSEKLPVPVINPGPLTYKLVESALDLGLTHSRRPYPKPLVDHADMVHAMLAAGKGKN